MFCQSRFFSRPPSNSAQLPLFTEHAVPVNFIKIRLARPVVLLAKIYIKFWSMEPEWRQFRPDTPLPTNEFLTVLRW